MNYTEKERKLVDKISRLIRDSKVDPNTAVVVMMAATARLAVRAATHTCHDFHEMAHDMFHDAEDVVAATATVVVVPQSDDGLKN